MELTDLIKLGFNKNEAIVYLALIRFGKADARMLIQQTKFHKNIVYDNLDKLIDKGLVSFIVEGKKKIFQITSSSSLLDFFEQKEKKFEEDKKKALQISKEIDKIAKHLPEKQEAMIFRGIKGIKAFYNETLKEKENYSIFGAPQKSISIMGETFWRNYNLKRIKLKIKVKMIFNPSIKEYGNSIKNKFTEIRYFKRNFEPETENHIQGDKVGIIVWSDEPVLFLIQSKKTAESYRKFFQDMWKIAKR